MDRFIFKTVIVKPFKRFDNFLPLIHEQLEFSYGKVVFHQFEDPKAGSNLPCQFHNLSDLCFPIHFQKQYQERNSS